MSSYPTSKLHDPSQPPPAPGRAAAGAPQTSERNAFNTGPSVTEDDVTTSCQSNLSGGRRNALSAELYDPPQPPLAPMRATAGPPQGLQGQSTPETRGRNAFNSERPLGVTPVPEGGVAIGGQSNLPEGRANMADKIVGKTEKVIGKFTNNPDMHERGELRETGGKAAAEGRARAAHD